MSDDVAAWLRTMQSFVEYCSRIDETFSERLVPASQGDIAEVGALAGMPVPPEYEAFLLTMGQTPPGTLGAFFDKVTFGVRDAKRFYTEPPIPVPDDAIYVWTRDYDAEMFLPVVKSEKGRPVISIGWAIDQDTGKFLLEERYVGVMAEGLMHYLYREAFQKLRIPSLQHYVSLRQNGDDGKPDAKYDQERRAGYAELLRKLGFEPLPFIDWRYPLYDRADAAIGISLEEYATDTVYVGADTAKELSRLRAIFEDNLGWEEV